MLPIAKKNSKRAFSGGIFGKNLLNYLIFKLVFLEKIRTNVTKFKKKNFPFLIKFSGRGKQKFSFNDSAYFLMNGKKKIN